MRKSVRLASLAFFAASLAGAQAAAPAPKAAASNGSTTPVFIPAADLKWVDIDPTGKVPGAKIADVWGDHTKGAYGAFVKFPAGFRAPLHSHTNSAKIVVVSGTFIQIPEGKAEVRLGPGSYMMQPGKGYMHVTACDKASECIFYSEGTGAFDIIMAEGAAAPPKK